MRTSLKKLPPPFFNVVSVSKERHLAMRVHTIELTLTKQHGNQLTVEIFE